MMRTKFNSGSGFFLYFCALFNISVMKKIKIVLFFVLAVVLAVSCKSKSEIYSKPETVTERFVKAFVTADFETMYKCTVPRNAALIREIQKSMRDNPLPRLLL